LLPNVETPFVNKKPAMSICRKKSGLLEAPILLPRQCCYR
jgi:hypothetical protein